MTGVRREVVSDTLLVTNIYHDMLEDTHRTPVANGDGEPTLQHIL